MSWFSKRIRLARTVFWRPWFKLAIIAWPFVATYDTLLSQIVPASVADQAPKLRDILAKTSGWLPWWGWLLVLACILIVQLFEDAMEQRIRHHSAQPPSGDGAAPFADSTPDIRVADDPACLILFDAPERDKLLPLLEAGKLNAWGRAGNGHPPLTRISPDLWATHFIEHHPGRGTGINQTFLKVKSRPYETSRYYDVHLNRSQLSRVWPQLETRAKPLPSFIDSVFLDTDDPAGAAVVVFTAAKSDRSVAVFLEHSFYSRHLAGAGWTKDRVVKLATISPFDYRMEYRQTVVSRLTLEGMPRLKWGTDPSTDDLISRDKYRAKIKFVSETLGERTLSIFMVPRLMTSGEPYVVVIDDREFTPQW